MFLPVFLIWAGSILAPMASGGDVLTGTVTAVHDGDTFTLKSGSSFYKIRLAEVDAPELGQTFGRQAREFTRHRVLGKRVRVNVALTDRYGRRIGEVIVEDGRVLNEELVHAGLAWYYRVNPVKNPRLQKLEREAFAHRLGLWLVDPPLPPWEFRRETVVPEPPANMSQVDYDRIFHYGIVGNRRTHIVRWPACQNYRRSKPRHALIFYSLQQARQMGFRFAKDCPQ